MNFGEVVRRVCQGVEHDCPEAQLSIVATEYRWTRGDREITVARKGVNAEGDRPAIRIMRTTNGVQGATVDIPLVRPNAARVAIQEIVGFLNGESTRA